jgi:hypothetical protein
MYQPTSTEVAIETTAPKPKSAAPRRDILTYVPADTLFFFGGLEAAPLQNALDAFMPEDNWMHEVDWSAASGKGESPAAEPAASKFITGLAVEYVKAIQDPARAAANLGIGKELDSVVYTVGALPVLRVKLKDRAAFEAFIERAEQSGNVSPVNATLGDVNYRSYSFSKPGETAAEGLDIVVATHNDYATLTLAPPVEREQTLKTAIGISKPSRSLADTQILQDLKKQYGFHPAYLGYISHQEIMKGLTDARGNTFGAMLEGFIKVGMEQRAERAETLQPGDTVPLAPDALPGDAPVMQHPLATIRTPACRSELMAIADNWPRTLLGYTRVEVDQRPMNLEAKALLESRDSVFLKDMQSLRGFIPAGLRDLSKKPVFGLGLGLNMDAVLPFISKTIQGIVQKSYQCEPLKNWQQQLAQSNSSAMVGMASGMLAGIQGLSFTVFGVDASVNLDTKKPDVRSIDALITLSANNPRSLLTMAANMAPPLANLQVPADGTPVELPVPMPMPGGKAPQIAIKGKHIVVYLGDKAKTAADELAADPMQANGLLVLNMDYGKYMRLIAESAAKARDNPDMTAEQRAGFESMQKAMSNFDAHLSESFDVTGDGIMIETRVKVN